ncbi:MAG: carboxypeptidase-like regulatory domain-containing protein [Planctomycetota bacterium]|jgi:hypothetical protein
MGNDRAKRWLGIAIGAQNPPDSAPAPTYDITGTIDDSAASPLESITVVLSGDASDSTATAGDGTYSFTVENGSYTVTPTAPAGKEFGPSSINVTVSGGNQTGKDFVQYLEIPYAEATIGTGVTDNNAFTPAGVTKGASWNWNGGRDGVGVDFPDIINGAYTGIRIAVLMFANEANRTLIWKLLNKTIAQVNAGTPAYDELYGMVGTLSADPDQLTSYARYNSESERSEHSGTSCGANCDSRRWHWFRIQFDHTAETVVGSCVRAEDDSQIWSQSTAMHADGQAIATIGDGLKSMYILAAESTSSVGVTRIWVGSTSDAWPSVAP